VRNDSGSGAFTGVSAITEKDATLITMFSKFARVGLLAGAVVITGLAGCESQPNPPTDSAPTGESADTTGVGAPKKGIKAFQRPAKGLPSQEALKPKS
jgi:hypothetical protein